MANKSSKKNPVKKTVVKKTATKSTMKKTSVRRAPVVADVPQMHECACGGACHCGCGCGCGHRFIKFCIKLIVLCMVFFLGCIASPWLVKNPGRHMMRNIAFDDNGCVVLETVKCPKLLESLATADDDANGCISRAELKSAMHEMRREKFDDMDDDDIDD